MKNLKNCKNIKIVTVTIALLLMLFVADAFTILPAVNAHTPAWTIPTWTYISAANNPIGVNQDLNLVFWVSSVPPTVLGAYGDRWTFTVEVTKPDKSKETLGPFTSDPVGGSYCPYQPTQVGTYSFVAKFAEHKITGTPVPPAGYTGLWASVGAYINDTYLASASDPITVVVQEAQIQPWKEVPLPTQYWTRPINNMNRDWDTLAGNWLGGAAQNVGPTTNFGFGLGPESAHILWTKQYWAGGTMDARFGEYGFYGGLTYESVGIRPPIILDGKLYYNVFSNPRYGWYCVDLYTGETQFFHNTTGPVMQAGYSTYGVLDSGAINGEALNFGQILNFETPNQHGGIPYLWSTGISLLFPSTLPVTKLQMFDAFTGNWICNIANVSAVGTNVYGKDGSLLWYNLVGSGANKRLTVWNTTQAIWYKSEFLYNSYWLWRPVLNTTYDGNNGFSLNVTIPAVQGSILAVREGQYVIGGTSGKNNGTYIQQGNLWALSLIAGEEGKLLWNITYTPPQTVIPDQVFASLNYGLMAGPTVDPEDGVFLFREPVTRRWWGFSLATGQQIWGPSAAEDSFNYYGMSSNIYHGLLLSYGQGQVGSDLVAYNITTGKVLWTYTPSQVGFESPYGKYPLSLGCIADGKIYMYSSEHSPTMPLWRGSYVRCINVSNGAELWKLSDWASGIAVSDGYLVGLNFYDTQIYCLGKGPSATTVSAPEVVIPQGTAVLIKGTGTDQSPGAKNLETKMGYTSGVPAISDTDQQAWMEYLYEQQAMPTKATGVKVHLTATDPNGNSQDIGYATSDTGGTYGITWTPPVPGTYQVTATFDGSKSYGNSYATTRFAVGPPNATPAIVPTQPPAPTSTQSQTAAPTLAPTATIAPTPSPVVIPPASSTPTATYIAIGAVVIIIIAAAAALILRRRK